MTANLPPQLLRLFVPRPPLPFSPPVDQEFQKKINISGISSILNLAKNHDLDYVKTDTPAEKKAKRVYFLFF
jgi:hypothetical protein